MLRFEPPDLLWAEFRGVLSLEETKRLVDVYRELGTSRPFYMVADLREVTAIPEELRRYLSEHADTKWLQGVIYVGARLAHRAVAKGLLIAAWLIGRAEKSELSKAHFVSTHAQAQELLARLRGATSS
ncbi:hypothetical protein [Archangium sp.]|uniref:hypothetical protein n=1 Tax=Archangium sp. TaxID=1872627 RepID=UPI00286D53F0|nr:hypothetical protein [Archangium sp.]